jgi:hypothetical protein
MPLGLNEHPLAYLHQHAKVVECALRGQLNQARRGFLS